MNHDQAINQLRKEGHAVDDNPDLNDMLNTTSPYTRGAAARLQERYWKLRGRS